MEKTEVTVIDRNVKTGVERKKINIICEQPKDWFAETHKEFTKDEKKKAKLNYKNQIK